MSAGILVDALLTGAVAAATPLLVAGLGELAAERAGVLNIGIEGLMLAGCFAAFAVTAATGNPWLGLGAAVLAAMALGGVFAVVSLTCRADQIVAGMAVNLLAVGGTGAAWRILQDRGLTDLPAGSGFTRGWTGIPALGELPVVGPLLFDQYGMTAFALVLAGVLALVRRRTRLGLVLHGVGQDPHALAASGVRVLGVRWGAVLFAAACAGLAGAYLSTMRTHAFVPLMTGGTGFVVLALVMFGRWSVGGLVVGCLLFGLAESAQQGLQSLPGARVVPHQLFQALPYLVALIALALAGRSAPGPAALGRPWPER